MDNLENIKVDTIPLNALMNIQVSGAFYNTIQQLLVALLSEKQDQMEELVPLLKELETRAPKNLWENQVVIFTALMTAIEDAAKEQKLIVREDASKFVSNSSEASPES